MKKNSYKVFFKAFGNDTRLAIVDALRGGPKNVGKICEVSGFEQSRVSHNLRYLETWGLIVSERVGKTVVYRLDEKNLVPVLDALDGYMERYGKKLCTCGVLAGKGRCKHLNEGR